MAIAGGGPTGLMLAGELALAGIDVVIVERRASQDLDSSRARGLHSRTIEVLDQRGIADRFLAEGQAVQIQSFARIPLDISDFPTRHNYGLALLQIYFERILAGWVGELGVPIAREREVTGFAQDDTGVRVELSDGPSLRADYLVGCDGGRSVIRKAAGIDVRRVGSDNELDHRRGRDETAAGVRPARGGGIGPVEDTGRVGVALEERDVEHAGEPTLQDLREALIAADGTDYGVHSPTWISRFTDMTRQAASYRKGRVLIAGDAAHVHPPQGGQGLNTGVQDAVNLGWKLAQVVNGTSPESLLDTYHAERHPVGARVQRNSMAQIALESLRRAHRRVARRHDRAAAHGRAAPAHRRDDLGARHPLRLRRRTPAARAAHARPRRAHRRTVRRRVFTLLHDARPVLLNLGAPDGFDISPWADRVRLVDANARRRVGAPGDRRGRRARGRVDPTRRACRLGGRSHRPGAPRRADHLVRRANSGSVEPDTRGFRRRAGACV